jgi:hypothetical protein
MMIATTKKKGQRMSLQRKINRARKHGRKLYVDKDGNTLVPLSPEAVDVLKKQVQCFKDKFGCEPGPGDPVFFDPDCDTPTQLDPGRLRTGTVAAMRAAGIREVLIYAYEKTGLVVTTQNKHLISDADMAEWNVACDEYQRVRHLEERPSSGGFRPIQREFGCPRSRQRSW